MVAANLQSGGAQVQPTINSPLPASSSTRGSQMNEVKLIEPEDLPEGAMA